MNQIWNGYESQPVFHYFTKISAIPRASGNEEGMVSFLLEFAAQKGLFAVRDEARNVFIKKPGSKGREDEAPLLLQCHTDMVAEKKAGVSHDFKKEGIVLKREDDRLFADGTTLGADDGIGVAMILSVLGDSELSHPPLECLFTAGEEVGMDGALAFDYSQIAARRMLNLDSSEENAVIIGCCGGVRSDLSLPYMPQSCREEALLLTIDGLAGGHSGEDIDKGRQNALSLMGKLLREIGEKTAFTLAYLTGGDKDNAIPRECKAAILSEEEETVRTVARIFENEVREKLTKEDSGFTLSVQKVPVSAHFTAADTEKVLSVLSVRNGVFAYRTEPPRLPRTSRNLARVRTEANEVNFGFSSRSELPAELEDSKTELDALADRIGAQNRHYAAYPGWVSSADSPMIRAYCRAYHEATGRETAPTVIHAGLECGLISERLPGLVALSAGPDVCDLHTPAETLSLSSAVRVYAAVCKFLALEF